jgi:hypothetical protein
MRYKMSFYDRYDDEDALRVKRERYEEEEMLAWEFEESPKEDEEEE